MAAAFGIINICRTHRLSMLVSLPGGRSSLAKVTQSESEPSKTRERYSSALGDNDKALLAVCADA